MEIAAFTFSSVSLAVSLGLLVHTLAIKFSTHKIQMVPFDGGGFESHSNPGPQKPFSPFADFEDPLTDDEKENLIKKKQI